MIGVVYIAETCLSELDQFEFPSSVLCHNSQLHFYCRLPQQGSIEVYFPIDNRRQKKAFHLLHPGSRDVLYRPKSISSSVHQEQQ